MTNYDMMLEIEYFKGRKEAIDKLVPHLANICASNIKKMNKEQTTFMEVSDFDKAEMEEDFRIFFNREIKEEHI